MRFTLRRAHRLDLHAIYGHVREGHEAWTQARALSVLLRVCEALVYAHGRGVVHGGLHPAKVLVDRDGEVHVADWRVARVVVTDGATEPPAADMRASAEASDEHEPQAVAYLAPEQLSGDRALPDARSDVHAVGAMLYHLLLVEHIEMPHVARGESVPPAGLLARVRQGPPARILELDNSISEELAAIAEKAMARAKEERYGDMELLAADLRAHLEGRPVKAFDTRPRARAARWVGRHKLPVMALAAAGLLLAGAVAFVDPVRAGSSGSLLERGAALRRDPVRFARLLEMPAETARFRARCRSLDGLEQLGESACCWWLDSADALVDGRTDEDASGAEWRPGLEDVRAALESLHADPACLPWTDEEAARDYRTHPELANLLHWRESRARELEEIDAALAAIAEQRDAPSAERAALQDRRAAVERRYQSWMEEASLKVRARRTWNYGDAALQEQVRVLDGLRDELEQIDALRVHARASTASARARARWAEAIDAIAQSPRYGGVRWPGGDRLAPQAGLLPLGENPATGLWEFVHLQTGSEPELGSDGRVLRDAQGRLRLAPGTGMVMVLLPGGRVPRAAAEAEQPRWIADLELAPFFLSKYELTAEQWDRLSLRRGWSATDGLPLAPANNASWTDIDALWVRELGWCSLPSEAQWEYGCRAGTTTLWWTGDDRQELRAAANIGRGRAQPGRLLEVGTLPANPFGLHDVHGNVWEWCADTADAHAAPRARDGLRDDGVAGSIRRAIRGGAWDVGPSFARSVYRGSNDPALRQPRTGLRPARGVTP